jgi:hypothetical protein
VSGFLHVLRISRQLREKKLSGNHHKSNKVLAYRKSCRLYLSLHLPNKVDVFRSG